MGKTFAYVQERYQILKGDDSTLTADTTGKSHINAAQGDVAGAHPFTWTKVTTTGTLTAGVFTLPTNYNPEFSIPYAAIDGVELTGKDPKSFAEDGGSFGFHVSYDAATNTFIFNCQTTTGTVDYQYHATPAELTLDADVCPVPDAECVAYLAAAKNWIGTERNQQLKADYQAEAERRIKEMVQKDAAFGPVYQEGSVLDYTILR